MKDTTNETQNSHSTWKYDESDGAFGSQKNFLGFHKVLNLEILMIKNQKTLDDQSHVVLVKLGK